MSDLAANPNGAIRVGIDIGGTFTDFVVYHSATGEIESFKLPSTPQDPSQAVIQGMTRIIESGQETPGYDVIHGSTVATNALLERKGAITALITTRGFRDILQIGRQARPELYDLGVKLPVPLIPEELRFEVNERVGAHAKVLVPLDLNELEKIIEKLYAQKVTSVAVCLLFSFLHPGHELDVAAVLRKAGFFVSPSCEILPEYREYERMSTTAVNAYVSPILDGYLSQLEDSLIKKSTETDIRLRVMQSNGGILRLSEARKNGVRSILSGPAGGVVGAQYVASLALHSRAGHLAGRPGALHVITFDMGGTSTDVSLIEDAPLVTTETVISGCPIRIPVLDIHTIGAGGGSIAFVDAGGALRVGPESAGAIPGPACYGVGEFPTVTDANLILGRLDADSFLGGQIRLDASRAGRAISRLGDALGLKRDQAALGVIEIANVHMERALRVISVERGHDPRDYTLLSFGGAGGLHASDLARRLGIPRLVIPPFASILSAFGMLVAQTVKDYSQTIMLPGDTPPGKIEERLADLVRKGILDLRDEGMPSELIWIERLVDIRYKGQSYELTVPWSKRLADDFHAAHQRIYGYHRSDTPLEIVNIRVRASGKIAPPILGEIPQGDGATTRAWFENRRVVFGWGVTEIPFFRGEALMPGDHLEGPAIVLRSDTTILLNPGDRAYIDRYCNLLIEVG